MLRQVCARLAAGAVLLVTLSAPPAGAQEDPLVGIWASESTFRPGALGELEVSRDGSGWWARLAGAEARFQVSGKDVRFAFPGDVGAFRGALADGDRAIDGFWLKPAGATAERSDPVASRQAFATPITLRRAGRGTWRATVRPLEERFTLYLKVFRGPDGALVGAFRNPDVNSNGGASHFRVSREGDAVVFTAGSDPAAPEVRLVGELARSPDRIRLVWADLGRTLELARRAPADVPAFFPRPPGAPPYAYRRPPETGDGWATARAGDVGIDEAALARLVTKLGEADPAARRPSLIHSLLVAHRGKLVLEEYFFGYDREVPHDTRSAGKTFASVMLGAAMMRGTKVSPETKLYELLARMGPFANPDPRKSRITLAHLMTHTSGLACDDYDDASPGNEDTLQRQRTDWWKYTLDLPMAYEPGTHYAYCSANTNLMGAALTTATGTWLPELFDRTVARPLEFGPYHWNLTPTGEGYLGGGAFLRPRDLLKVGQAYLDGGVWRGRRIVDASWVAQSTAPRVKISPETTGLDAEQFSERYFGGDDALAWHPGAVRSGDRTYRHYSATGNGGQLLLVIPDLDLAVVFTGGNYRQGGIWGRWGDEIVGAQIIPAIRR